MAYDVFGMCNPLFDIQAEIPDTLLQELAFGKGGMWLIDEQQQRDLVAKIYTHIVNSEPGGSGANTMIGIAQLGGTPCYTGKIGNDEHGTLYAKGLQEKGVRVLTAVGESETGICVVLITPDAQRTLCTYLGICRELNADDVIAEAIRESKYIYVTSYLWDTETQKAAVLKAMRTAKEYGVKVALSLSDPFCVHRNHADLKQVIFDHVDLLLGNDEEAMALTGTDNAYEAIRAMSAYCDLAAVTMSSKGSLLRDGDTLLDIAPFSVQPVDTTGAGDIYAAGLLYGITHDLPLKTAGKLASYLSAQVVAQLGPRLHQMDTAAVAAICAEN